MSCQGLWVGGGKKTSLTEVASMLYSASLYKLDWRIFFLIKIFLFSVAVDCIHINYNNFSSKTSGITFRFRCFCVATVANFRRGVCRSIWGAHGSAQYQSDSNGAAKRLCKNYKKCSPVSGSYKSLKIESLGHWIW